MIDSHSHLYCDAFDTDRREVMMRALEAGVTHVVLPNENMESVERVVAMHNDYPTSTSIALGLHPEDVDGGYEQQLAAMCPLLDKYNPVAVGEIGIDLYWDKTWREQQMHALDTQLHWCKELGIPFIMHCREALDEILYVLDNFGESLPQGVFHSFTGTPEQVEQVRRRGDFYFGVNGIVTFKKSPVKEILPVVGLDRLLLETDSPYLSPVPHRGKRNESAFVQHVCRFVAQYLGVGDDEVDAVTTGNAVALFALDI